MAPPLQAFRKEVKGASIFQWNARGLKPRISDIRQFVFKNQFPIIVICEPRLHNAIRLSRYEAFKSATCNEQSKVIVYIRCDLTYIEHRVAPHDDNQYVCLTVKRRDLNFTLVGAYISPSNRFEPERLRALLTATPGPWIITGDFNAHHPLWGSQKTDSRGRQVFSFALEQQLLCVNDGSPTFLRGTTYSSCLDLTFVSRSLNGKVKWFADYETHGSDHIPTYLKIKGLEKSPNYDTSTRIDWTKFRSLTEKRCQENKTPPLDTLEDMIRGATQEATYHIQHTSEYCQHQAELERLRAIRRRAERRYRRTKSIHDLREARRLQKKIQRRINSLQSFCWKYLCEAFDADMEDCSWPTNIATSTSPLQVSFSPPRTHRN